MGLVIPITATAIATYRRPMVGFGPASRGVRVVVAPLLVQGRAPSRSTARPPPIQISERPPRAGCVTTASQIGKAASTTMRLFS